jgi:hypothetical protein
MLFRLYKLLYKVTRNRRWLLKCVDIIQQKAWEDIRKFREEVENETN